MFFLPLSFPCNSVVYQCLFSHADSEEKVIYLHLITTATGTSMSLKNPYKAKYRKRKLKFATAQPFQKQNTDVNCDNLLHRSVAIMQRQIARINSTETNSFLTITTEGCAGCAGRRSESSSSIPSESPSTSVTVRSIVACFAFIVSILHFEFKEAICSWYPLIFCASSWGNILSLMQKQPTQTTGLAAFQLLWSFPS